MKHAHAIRIAIAPLVLTTAILLTGCAAPHRSTSLDTSAGPVGSAAIPAGFLRPASGAPAGGGTNGGGTNGGGGAVATPGLPASWPLDAPVPPGRILGSTDSIGRWTLLLLERGSAAQVLQSAGAFYRAAGYLRASASLWNNGNRHITLVVENRDHSATRTFLAIQLTTA